LREPLPAEDGHNFRNWSTQMAIVERITRLFTADVHAVLDRLEAPDALLRQAIREMEAALAEHTQQLKALELDRELVRRRGGEIERSLASIREEIDLSYAAGNEALLRTCLRRRLEAERLQRMLEQRAAALTQQIDQATPVLEQQRERLVSMRQKAALFDIEATPCANADGTHWSNGETGVSEADIDLALLRERQRRVS
jgi:phage shock protein A